MPSGSPGRRGESSGEGWREEGEKEALKDTELIPPPPPVHGQRSQAPPGRDVPSARPGRMSQQRPGWRGPGVGA
ncbi:hypothetical protein NDU88_000630 [Pleurodeles waltl]|uniref:Uncharacterized protein n=1 Tax=Pleurodeles waltl TaxID=8319 RepID=A0AAV7Q4M9_PLEWA|nr:hypothetical protein NDU88_000630 [Pleurodeles waltl]